MIVLVDTNVIVDVVEEDPEWAEWSASKLRQLASVYEPAINPIIYSEAPLAFDAIEDLEAVLGDMEFRYLEIPQAALFLAGKAFLKYQRTGGVKTNVLADFFIGAHAAVIACPILTRDPVRYRYYFPSVQLITPEG